MSHGIEVTHESIKESLHHIPPGKVGPLVVPSQVNTAATAAATAAAANDDIPCFFIPSELFLQASSLDDLRQNFRSEFRGYSDRSRRRVFASHRWLTYQHPDPQNVQFRSLQALFASNDAEKFLVLYDYLSFPSDVPIVDIVRKLDSIVESCDIFLILHLDAAYMNRGWCFFEYFAAFLRLCAQGKSEFPFLSLTLCGESVYLRYPLLESNNGLMRQIIGFARLIVPSDSQSRTMRREACFDEVHPVHYLFRHLQFSRSTDKVFLFEYFEKNWRAYAGRVRLYDNKLNTNDGSVLMLEPDKLWWRDRIGLGKGDPSYYVSSFPAAAVKCPYNWGPLPSNHIVAAKIPHHLFHLKDWGSLDDAASLTFPLLSYVFETPKPTAGPRARRCIFAPSRC